MKCEELRGIRSVWFVSDTTVQKKGGHNSKMEMKIESNEDTTI